MTTTETHARPFWLPNGCPEWCRTGHSVEDHPDDRVHYSEGFEIPLSLEPAEKTFPLGTFVPACIAAHLRQTEGSSEACVEISHQEEGPTFTLTLIEARQFAGMLSDLVDLEVS
jgi:hypothetical protein